LSREFVKLISVRSRALNDNTSHNVPLTKIGKEQNMDEKYVDPVCGMEISAEEAADSVEYDGETYYFCSPGCRAAFEAAPERYIRPIAGSTR
jgi:YHS domain-containing protein